MEKCNFKLLVIETPVKLRRILNCFENHVSNWHFIATRGNLFDLETENSFSTTTFEPYLKPANNHIIKSLIEVAGKVDEIYIGTDYDESGEYIACQVAKKLFSIFPNKPVWRIRYKEINEQSLLNAINNKENFNYNLKESKESKYLCRAILKQSYSKLLKDVFDSSSIYMESTLQASVLRLIVNRELSIKRFNQQKLYHLNIKFKNGKTITSELIWSKTETEKLKNSIYDFKVFYSEKEETIYPPYIFNTPEILKTATEKFDFSIYETYRYLEDLYNNGLISFYKTDSNSISLAISKLIQNYINGILPGFSTNTNFVSDNTEGIRITDIRVVPSSLTGKAEIKEIYKLIWSRCMASQTIPAKMVKQRIEIKQGNKIIAYLNGGYFTQLGWHQTSFNTFLKRCEKIDKEKLEINYQDTSYTETFSSPMPSWTEATILEKIKSSKITDFDEYAEVIHELEELNYIKKIGKNLKPTYRGIIISNFLQDGSPYLSDFEQVSKIEMDKKRISTGENTKLDIIKNFYETIKDKVKLLNKQAVLSTDHCPDCNETLEVGVGNKLDEAPYLWCGQCEEYFSFNLDRFCNSYVMFTDQKLELECLDCKTKDLILTYGKFGKYIKCNCCQKNFSLNKYGLFLNQEGLE